MTAHVPTNRVAIFRSFFSFDLSGESGTVKSVNLKLTSSPNKSGTINTIWNDKTFKLAKPVYDPIAFIYYLRSQDLSLGDSFKFLSAGSGKVKEVIVNITKVENIKVSAGVFNCLKIEPVSSDGKPLLKNNGEMRVWLSNDKERLPVKIELKTNIGTMVMKLKERKYSTY